MNLNLKGFKNFDTFNIYIDDIYNIVYNRHSLWLYNDRKGFIKNQRISFPNNNILISNTFYK